MEMNSSSSLDSLANYGVIDFDADAYIKGTKARYVGRPNGGEYLPLDQPLYSPNYGIAPGAHLSGHPSQDAFVDRGETKRTSWNGIFAGGIIAALAIFGGSKVKEIFTKNPDKVTEMTSLFQKCKDGVKKFFKNSESKAVEESIKQKTSVVAETAATEAAKTSTNGAKKGIIRSVLDKISGLPKKVKVAGGIGLGVFGLYEIYKHLTPPQIHNHQE